MSNSTILEALACPSPFLPATKFPYVGGQQDGRFCAPSPFENTISCCLPCPLTDWVYPDSFNTVSYIANWVAVASLACCAFLLLSFAVLPAKRTSRHYLTICLVVAIFFIELAFIVPLGTKPDQCFDEITPNNLNSDVSCAVTGVFLLGGGIGGVMWVFIRSLSVHLQIYWKIVPGTRFFYLAQLGGWGVTALILGFSLSMSGVSYRLGTTCHINHHNSIATFWGPLLGFAGLALLIQLVTFAYCLKVYLEIAKSPSGLPSLGSSTQYTNASGSNQSVIAKRATYRRIRKVVALHWRGIAVIMIVIASVAYLATVFLILDTEVTHVQQHFDLAIPWIECLAASEDKSKCVDLTSSFVVNERVLLPVLYLIAFIGIWALLFLGQFDMFRGWAVLIASPCRGRGRSRSGSPSLYAKSQESFSTRMPEGVQQFHMVKGDRGLNVVNKENDAMYASDLPKVGLTRSLSHDDYTDPGNNDKIYELDSFSEESQSYGNPYHQGPSAAQSPAAAASHVSYSLDKVWAPPRSQPSRNRRTPNFSQPAPSQPRSDTYNEQSLYRRESAASAERDAWYTADPPTNDDTRPLSPQAMPTATAPAAAAWPSGRRRMPVDSVASSVYSVQLPMMPTGPMPGYVPQNTIREQTRPPTLQRRPSQGMTWTGARGMRSPSPTVPGRSDWDQRHVHVNPHQMRGPSPALSRPRPLP